MTEIPRLVLAAARSLKNEKATRHGDAVQVGSYQMIEDIRALIGFNDFGLSGVDYLRPGRTRTLFNGRLAACSMSILMPLSACGLRYWLKPPLDPDADEPSAVDLVTLNKNREYHAYRKSPPRCCRADGA